LFLLQQRIAYAIPDVHYRLALFAARHFLVYLTAMPTYAHYHRAYRFLCRCALVLDILPSYRRTDTACHPPYCTVSVHYLQTPPRAFATFCHSHYISLTQPRAAHRRLLYLPCRCSYRAARRTGYWALPRTRYRAHTPRLLVALLLRAFSFLLRRALCCRSLPWMGFTTPPFILLSRSTPRAMRPHCMRAALRYLPYLRLRHCCSATAYALSATWIGLIAPRAPATTTHLRLPAATQHLGLTQHTPVRSHRHTARAPLRPYLTAPAARTVPRFGTPPTPPSIFSPFLPAYRARCHARSCRLRLSSTYAPGMLPALHAAAPFASLRCRWTQFSTATAASAVLACLRALPSPRRSQHAVYSVSSTHYYCGCASLPVLLRHAAPRCCASYAHTLPRHFAHAHKRHSAADAITPLPPVAGCYWLPPAYRDFSRLPLGYVRSSHLDLADRTHAIHGTCSRDAHLLLDLVRLYRLGPPAPLATAGLPVTLFIYHHPSPLIPGFLHRSPVFSGLYDSYLQRAGPFCAALCGVLYTAGLLNILAIDHAPAPLTQ